MRSLQILLQGIILKPFKMLMAKHYLRKVGAEAGVPHTFLSGGWGMEVLTIKKLIKY
jgi:hypothetical protein